VVIIGMLECHTVGIKVRVIILIVVAPKRSVLGPTVRLTR
jgi:hypothetical protein